MKTTLREALTKCRVHGLWVDDGSGLVSPDELEEIHLELDPDYLESLVHFAWHASTGTGSILPVGVGRPLICERPAPERTP